MELLPPKPLRLHAFDLKGLTLKIVLPDPKNPKAKAKVYLDERDLDQRDEQGYQEVKNVQVSKSTISFLTDTYFESEVFDGVKYPPGH